jgi:hypothetical protein
LRGPGFGVTPASLRTAANPRGGRGKGDPAFEEIVRQFKEGGAPLKPFERAMASMQWETGRAKARRLPALWDDEEVA